MVAISLFMNFQSIAVDLQTYDFNHSVTPFTVGAEDSSLPTGSGLVFSGAGRRQSELLRVSYLAKFPVLAAVSDFKSWWCAGAMESGWQGTLHSDGQEADGGFDRCDEWHVEGWGTVRCFRLDHCSAYCSVSICGFGGWQTLPN
jgi:hypothetical protein